MAKHARIARSDHDLPPHLRARLEAIRAELRQLNYRRMTDEELAEALDLDVQAKASNAVEGLYADAAEDAFFQMMDEERVPNEMRGPYIVWFVLGEKRDPIDQPRLRNCPTRISTPSPVSCGTGTGSQTRKPSNVSKPT